MGGWAAARAAAGDVGGLGYGVGRYWSMSVTRATCWADVGSAFAALRPRTRWSGAAGLEEVDPNAPDRNAAPVVVVVPPPTHARAMDAELARCTPHLGHDVLMFGDDTYHVRVKWALDFDCTGDVESNLSLQLVLRKASMYLPAHAPSHQPNCPLEFLHRTNWGVCLAEEESDDRGLKVKASRLFRKMVKRFGPGSAIKEVIAFLFEDFDA
jgi:hypothetical protein